MTVRKWVALSCVLALGACSPDEAADPVGSEPVVAEVEPIELRAENELPEEPDVEDIAAEDFPLPEDFEEEAAQEITSENLEVQIAALEAELAE